MLMMWLNCKEMKKKKMVVFTANAEKGGAQEKPSPLKRRSTRASLKTQMSLSGKTEVERAFQDPKIYWEEHYEDKSEILWSQ